jgi:hypothetical protein
MKKKIEFTPKELDVMAIAFAEYNVDFREVAVVAIRHSNLNDLYMALRELAVVPSEQSITEVLQEVLDELTEADRAAYDELTAGGFSIVEGALRYGKHR